MAYEPGTAPATSDSRGDIFSPLIQRLTAASGITFVVLVILSIVFGGEETPDWAAPATEYAQFNGAHADSAQLGSLFLLLAALELLVFAGYLRGELGRYEQAARGFARAASTAFGGGIVAAVGLALTALMTAVAVSQVADTPPEIVRSLHQISYATFGLASLGLVVLLSAGSLLALRTPALPSWIGWVGLIGAAAYFLSLFIVLSPADEDFVFNFAWIPGFLALLIWVAGSSIVLVRRAGRTDAPVSGPSATT